jgi:DNA-directed DNA polymerase III PolC
MFLNAKSYFSFRYGTYTTEQLVQDAVQFGVQSLALTNINSTCDAWDFVHFCTEQNIKPIIGVEVRNGDVLCYILLAKNNAGVYAINNFLSEYLQSDTAFPERFPMHENVFVIYALHKQPAVLLPNEFIGIKPAEVHKLFKVEDALIKTKCVVWQPVTFQNKTYYNVHRLLRAIDKNILLSQQHKTHIAEATESFVPITNIISAFAQHACIITNTLQLMDSCSVHMDFGIDKNKKHFTTCKADDMALLKKLAYDGMQYRYGKNCKQAKLQIDKELKVIDELNFNAYFLITWDAIRYAQSRNFFYVGRGSGANSIVAYCLQITDVDPIELDLYFERFLNPSRTSPPDFDMDFSWKDRDEMIDYFFKRYGKHHVTLLGMYSTFQHSAIVRELGKVFGLPKAEMDAMLESKTYNYSDDSIQKLIVKYGALLTNFPNHLSIHPGGILISEEPIYNYATVHMPPKGFATAMLDMFVSEKIGLYKYDVLSQRGLGHIKDATLLVKQNKKIHIDIHDVEKFKTDVAVAQNIKNANTIGCFYIESPAMRQLLKKLRCADYVTLVAASSIIRPGVSKSGMMKAYIHRFNNPNSFEYLHPKMQELLQETYGVMVFQEDVIKVAHYFAGLEMSEGDILRRAMSGKYRSSKEMDRIREKFYTNCHAFGYESAITQEVWRQMESFAGYSFSKAHSASYAVESYQSLYLKTHYPMEFMVAVINNFGGFYSTALYVHELARTGAQVRLPCVNNSDMLTNIKGSMVHLGLGLIEGINQETIECLLQEREHNGAFISLQNFIERTNIMGVHLNSLIRIGAFAFTGIAKKELLWHANFFGTIHKPIALQNTCLFVNTQAVSTQLLPKLDHCFVDDAIDQLELLGFTIANPFIMLANKEKYKCVLAQNLPALLGMQVTVIGFLVTTKYVRTVKKDVMYFGTFIDEIGNWLDTVHFADSVQKYPLQGKGFYLMKGKVVQEFGVYNVEVHWLQKMGICTREDSIKQENLEGISGFENVKA